MRDLRKTTARFMTAFFLTAALSPLLAKAAEAEEAKSEAAKSAVLEAERSGANAEGQPCELSNWSASILKGSPKERSAAVKALSEAPAACLRPMLKRLQTIEMGPKEYDDIRKVFKWAQIPVPVYSGWFKVPKLKKGEAPAHREVDLLAKLQSYKEPRSDELKAAYRRSLLLCALVRGLGQLEHTAVAEPLVRFTFKRVGFSLRHEVSRALERLRAYAVPGLLELAALDARDWKSDRVRYLLQKYSSYMLNVLREGDPQTALSWADYPLKTKLFEAYGKHRVAAAARAIVSYTDAEDPGIQEAARKALLAYFKGPRPRTVRRHLKLPGGAETRDRRLVYMNFRQRATHEVKVELERLTSGAYKRRVPGKILVKKLFAEQDRRRRERDKRWLERAQAKWRGGDKDKAIALMEGLLAREPGTSLAPKLGSYFRLHAVSHFTEGRLDEALRYLSLAYTLVEDEDDQRRILSEMAYVRGLRREAHGAPRSQALSAHQEALRWWRRNEPARRATVALERNTLEPGHAYLLAACSGATALLIFWLLGVLLRKKKQG